jgi:two-component system chemotaxis sensor kinase CheA
VSFDPSVYISAFREEAAEHLQRIASLLLALEQDPHNPATVRELFRAAHTLKGGARMVGLGAIGDLAHRVEDVLDDLRHGMATADRRLMDVLLQAHDALQALVGANGDAAQAGVDVTALTQQLEAERARLRAAAAGTPATAAQPAVSPPTAPAPRVAPPAGAAAPALQEPKAGPRPELAAAAGEPAAGVSAPGMPGTLTIRVPVESIDRVLSLASALLVRWRGEGTILEDLAALADELEELTGEHTAESSVLLRRLGELHVQLTMRLGQLTKVQQTAARELSDLHYELEQLSLQPLSILFGRFHRHVRDVAKMLGKQVRLVTEGDMLRLDRGVIQMLYDPLLHLVRNAIDHGIEPPHERLARGKPAEGRITLSAYQVGDRAIIEVADDGAGIDTARLIDAALRRNLITPQQAVQITPREALELIYLPGLSTSSTVGDLSGRGVGMDVVRAAIEALHGYMSIYTQPGLGTRFALEVPVTLAISRALIVRAGEVYIALPARVIDGMLEVGAAAISTMQGRRTIEFDGEPVPLVSLHAALGLSPDSAGDPDGPPRPAVVVRGPHELRIAFAVDELVDHESIVTKPLPRLLGRLPCITAVTSLATGEVAFLADTAALIDTALRRIPPGVRLTPVQRPSRTVRRVLVVDDSLTSRELERSILEAAGYAVETAVDGVQALERLGQQTFDAVICDVEMPRLDGFALTQAIRADARLQHLPVILVTSLERPEERQRGLEAGAQVYITKGAFDQDTLLETIARLAG